MENYQFVKQIGQGSYGEIWLVKCSKTRKKHVLKRIDLHQASKREQRAAHLEVKLLSTVKHPNIVSYLDSFHNSFGSLFIVMNYCECGDLYTFIKHQNGVYFEEKQVVHWFVQICLALKYLHDKNILHRNLKTRNIFLTKNKIIKVGDLGISKVLSIAHEMTATLIETPYYISPEIFAGKSYNEKSDIWALGCCTYEITTLKHPYIALDTHSLLQNIMKRKLPPIPEMYSFELYDIISSMLDKESENRPCVTQLLLNDYIRKYILLVLQDNSKSSDGQNSANSGDSSSAERPKSNSDFSLVVPKSRSNDIQRSMSTCFLPRNTSNNSKISGTAAKSNKVSNGKSLIINVPDVNGNGDGNDNSQHGRIINAGKRATGYVNHEEISYENKNYLRVNGDIKTPVELRTNSSGTFSSPNSLKNSEINAIANVQRMKGEISLRILNNLTYSLHTTRYENFKDRSSYTSNGCSNSESTRMHFNYSKSPASDSAEKQPTERTVKGITYSQYITRQDNFKDKSSCTGDEHFESSHINSDYRKSPISDFTEKESAKRTVRNLLHDKKVTFKGKARSNVCALPQIKHDTKLKKIPKSASHTKKLPHVRSQNYKENKQSTVKKPGSKVDNLPSKKGVKPNEFTKI